MKYGTLNTASEGGTFSYTLRKRTTSNATFPLNSEGIYAGSFRVPAGDVVHESCSKINLYHTKMTTRLQLAEPVAISTGRFVTMAKLSLSKARALQR